MISLPISAWDTLGLVELCGSLLHIWLIINACFLFLEESMKELKKQPLFIGPLGDVTCTQDEHFQGSLGQNQGAVDQTSGGRMDGYKRPSLIKGSL